MNSRKWTCLGLFVWAVLFFGTAWSQDVVPRRIDPGQTPPDLGAPAMWDVVAIPGLAAGSSLGTLSVRATDGALFVWAMSRELPTLVKPAATPAGSSPRIDPGDPQFPGEGGPPVPGVDRTIPVSTLYQFKDGTWVPTLVAKGQTGAFVYATPYGDVFASTNLPDGSMQVFHRYSVQGWHLEKMPFGVSGPAGAFAGEFGAYMRAGTTILRHLEHEWLIAYECEDFPLGGGLAVLDGGQILASCEGHEHIFDGKSWITEKESLPTHIHSLWGGRDVAGALHLFAGGSDLANTGMLIYEFVETDPGTMIGHFELAFADPLFGTGTGSVNTVWGGDVHEIYATGVLDGVGQLYQFNGAGWVNAAPEGNLPAMVGVGGTAQDGLWVSLVDGRLLHRPAVASEFGEAVPPIAKPGEGRTELRDLTVTSAPGPQATLEFSLPEARDVAVVFFDLNGRRVDAMAPGRLPAGVNRLTWGAERLASGMYFCRVEAGAMRVTRKVLIQK